MGNQFHSNAAHFATEDMNAFLRGYVMAAYWTSTGDNEQPDSEAELSEEGFGRAYADCFAFQSVNANLLAEAYDLEGYDESRAGHDFWLSRNGHGSGFFDREELDHDGLAGALQEAAAECGTCDLYEGDDGKLYFA